MARFLLDVDDVCAQFKPPLVRRLQIQFPDWEGIDLAEEKDWDILPTLPPAISNFACEILEDSTFWAVQPVMDGVVSAIRQIRQAGHEIHWVTSAWLTCREWGYRRRMWLQAAFDAKPLDITITSNKAVVSGQVFIDDRYENVKKWHSANPECAAFLFDHPFNKQYYDFELVKWDRPNIDMLIEVGDRIDDHRTYKE